MTVDFNELRQQIDSITLELKAKAPKKLSMLVESQSIMVRLILEMSSTLLSQNNELTKQISKLNQTIDSLQETIRDQKRQLNQNSNNSSKPPSSDGYKKSPKKRSLRVSTGAKAGGQKGHKGANLSVPHAPDEVKCHIPSKCQCCPNLKTCVASGEVFTCAESRYVIEAKTITHVVEHQSMVATNCPCCCPLKGEILVGEFPKDVRGYVQYGNSVTVLAALLSTYGAVAYNRIHVLLNGLFGISLSTGTINSMIKRCSDKISPIMEKIRELLKDSAVVNFDETGLRAIGKLLWAHNSSNDKYTYQSVNEKRGSIGMEDNGVLPDFTGIAVHDCWGSYQNFEQIEHALCCAHLLRKLNAVKENEERHIWAERFQILLIKMKTAKEKAVLLGQTFLRKELLEAFSKEYDDIMCYADIECPPPEVPKERKRGKIKKGKTRALIERLKKFKDDVCRFVHNFAVPFDNNQAERDVRNVKTKTKVSGCFRSIKGAQDYLKIMSFISTGNKHGINAFDALTAAFSGNAEIILSDGSEWLREIL